ncbi:hypothetical protein [Acidocella facilis]|uniref:hypothetical protein n=1 Tax=Acidocella facilis TaxID=525 RepID=UPI001F445D1E|nr:hypothetical protein [Acidocella facilis]
MSKIEANHSTTPLKEAISATCRLRDAISAIALIVRDPWKGTDADRARNSLQWLSDVMDAEADRLADAVDDLAREAQA